MHVKNVLVAATRQMKAIFFQHVRLAFFISILQLRAHYQCIVNVLSVVLFLNLMCLSERIWDVQSRTLIYWPVGTQWVFLVSRLAIVAVVIVLVSIILRVLLGHAVASSVDRVLGFEE